MGASATGLLKRIWRVSVKSAIVVPAGVVNDSVWYVLLTALRGRLPPAGRCRRCSSCPRLTPAMAADGFQALLAQVLPAAAQLYTW